MLNKIKEILKKLKEILKPNKRDFWGHIADARVNKNNPDYELVTVTDRLTKTHKTYSEARGLDPLETPIHETINAIDLLITMEKLELS